MLPESLPGLLLRSVPVSLLQGELGVAHKREEGFVRSELDQDAHRKILDVSWKIFEPDVYTQVETSVSLC